MSLGTACLRPERGLRRDPVNRFVFDAKGFEEGGKEETPQLC